MYFSQVHRIDHMLDDKTSLNKSMSLKSYQLSFLITMKLEINSKRKARRVLQDGKLWRSAAQ